MKNGRMEPLRRIESRALVLPQENIDTDQIIPARFLTTTRRADLGVGAFADWRLDGEGRPRTDCALNDPRAAGASILVAGHNFGCGSSREHAPWALHELGIRAVVSTGIADIFRANAGQNGIVPIVLPFEAHAELCSQPWCEVVVDIEACELSICPHPPIPFSLDAFTRHCLLEGIDPLDFLLSHTNAIHRFEATRTS